MDEQRKKKLDEIAMKCQSLVRKKQISSPQFAKINSVLLNKNEYWINGALLFKDDDEEFIKYINEDIEEKKYGSKGLDQSNAIEIPISDETPSLSPSNKSTFAGNIDTEKADSQLPFCNREDALFKLLRSSFLNWVISLPEDFVRLYHCNNLYAYIRKPMFMAALTAMGMGKTRIVCDWAKEVLNHLDLLDAFTHGDWLRHINSSDSSQIANITISDSFDWNEVPVYKENLELEDLIRLFLFELKDAVDSSRYLGIQLSAEVIDSRPCRQQVKDIVKSSVLYSLITAAAGKIIYVKGSPVYIEKFKYIFDDFYQNYIQSNLPKYKFLIECSTQEIIDIYASNLQTQSNLVILQPLRNMGSRPIVFILVDDFHVFEDIRADSNDTNVGEGKITSPPANMNGLYFFVNTMSRLLKPIMNQPVALSYFAGNASLMNVEKHIDKTIWQVDCLPLNILFSVKHFNFLFNNRFSNVDSTKKEAAEELKFALWRNFRKWLGVPRIIDFLFGSTRMIVGSELEHLELDKSRRDHQLSQLDSNVTLKTEAYYRLSSESNTELNTEISPYILLTVAAGVPTPRSRIVPDTNLSFGDLEIKGFLFPANDYSQNIIWASNLLYFDVKQWPIKYPTLFPLISSQSTTELDNIAHPIDDELRSPASLLKLIFDPFLTREQVWKKPDEKGAALEYAVAGSIWLRYVLQKLSFNQISIPLSSLIYSLPTSLLEARVTLNGVMKLDKQFPSTITALPKNYIYINCPKTSYADVFFWADIDSKPILIGIQCKNAKRKMTSSLIEKVFNKTQQKVKCDHLLFVLINHYNPNNDLGFADSSSIVPPYLLEYCTLLDGRGLLPHFWWIATYEHLSQKIVPESSIYAAMPDNSDE